MRNTTIEEACTLHARIGWQGLTKKEYLDEGDFYLVTGVDFDHGHIAFDNCHFVTKERYDQDEHIQLKIDDILVTKDGTIGKVAIIDKPISKPATLNSGVFVVRPKDKTMLLPRYLMYALQSNHFCNFIDKIKVGCTIAHLNQEKFLKYSFALPDVEKQKHIIAIFDKLYCIAEMEKNMLQKLEKLIKARFVELFRDKYPEDTIINLCNIIDYRGKTPEKVDDGLPFITAKNVRMHQMSLEPREYISKDTYDKVMVRGFPKEGDVVFTTEAPLGNVCRIPHFDTEFYIGQRIVTMQTERLNPVYLEYALSTEEFRRQYMGKSSGSTVTGIRVRLLEQLTIPVPPNDIQDQFAEFVHQIDKSRFEVQKALEETQLLMDSLMQEYFG